MNRSIILIAVFLSARAFAQESDREIKSKIVGAWSTFLTSGDSGIFHFNADGSMFLVTPNGTVGKGEMKLNDGRTVKSLMRYILNPNTEPIQIDFYYAVDTYYNVIAKAEGIIELLDDNLLRIAMNYNRPQPVRPQNFDNPTEAGVLNRKGKAIHAEACDRFWTGNFEMTDSFTGVTRISRDKGIQVESNELGDKVRLKIEWTSDCSYTLTPIEFFYDNKWVADTTDIVQTVDIIKTKTNSYIFSTGNNKTTLRTTREMFVARE